jgi:hypothetical protein
MKDTEYELFAKEIYEYLLKDKGVTVDVKHNVDVLGKAYKHQIDVYWEYNINDVKRRVAIECKNYGKKTPVSIGHVRNFFGALHDIGDDIDGIIVTKNKFQKGAKKFADYYGIKLKELKKPNIQIIEFFTQFPKPISKSTQIFFDEFWLKDNLKISRTELDESTRGALKKKFLLCNSKGETIKPLPDLLKDIPADMVEEQNKIYTFEWDDMYLNVESIGPVKILKITWIYDVKVVRQDIREDADEFARGILKDAKTGKLKRFNHNGEKF